MSTTRQALLAGIPAELAATPEQVSAARTDPRGRARQLVVLDDDPTGTQSVADLPVLTSWTSDDLAWALETGPKRFM